MKKKKTLRELYKNKKFRIAFVAVVLLIIALAVFLYYKFSDKSVAVETAEVKKGTVKQYYDTTGTLITGSMGDFQLYEGVLVKEVKVKPGDAVKKDDVLATFDTSSMNAIISDKRKALNAAIDNYNSAAGSKNDNNARVNALNKQIAELQSQQSQTGATTENQQQLTEEQIEAIVSASGNLTEEQKTALRQQLSNYNSNPTSQISALEAERDLINTNQYDNVIETYKQVMDSARAEYNNAVAEKKKLDAGFVAEKDGKVGEVYIKAGEVYTYIAPKSDNANLMSILSGSSPEVSEDVSSIVSGVLSNNGTNTAKKGIALTVDYYSGYKVGFSLGKYDVQKIALDMPAIVEYTDFKYNAVVTAISARAESGGTDISTITSSMMGGSSISGSGAGVEAEATITNPNDKLVIGFDAKLSILTAEHKNVITIPVESLVIEDGEKFVYVITDDNKAKKTIVETGVSSETLYEVTKGLKVGQKVIVNSSEVTDGIEVHVGER